MFNTGLFHDLFVIRSVESNPWALFGMKVMRIAAVIRMTKKIYYLVQHIDCRYQFEFSLRPGIVLSTIVQIANIIRMTVVRIANIIDTDVVRIAKIIGTTLVLIDTSALFRGCSSEFHSAIKRCH